jgi:hypothetical protein
MPDNTPNSYTAPVTGWPLSLFLASQSLASRLRADRSVRPPPECFIVVDYKLTACAFSRTTGSAQRGKA